MLNVLNIKLFREAINICRLDSLYWSLSIHERHDAIMYCFGILSHKMPIGEVWGGVK